MACIKRQRPTSFLLALPELDRGRPTRGIMNNNRILIAFAVISCGLLAASGSIAHARSGSNGGGGGGSSSGGASGGGINRHGGSFNLTYTSTGAGGSRSSCLGGYNLTTYVTTLSLDYVCKNLELPDGTQIYGIVYTTDYYTGIPWAPMNAGVSSVLGGKATLRNPNVVTTGVNGLPVMQVVELRLADGTLLFSGTP